MSEWQKAMIDGNEAAASVAHRAPPDRECMALTLVRFLLVDHHASVSPAAGGIAMIIEREFAVEGHVFRLAVEQAAIGWDVQERRDSTIVHVEHHDDWHRVERAVRLLELAALRHDASHADRRRAA